MNTKRVLGYVFAAVLASTLAACGGGGDAAPASASSGDTSTAANPPAAAASSITVGTGGGSSTQTQTTTPTVNPTYSAAQMSVAAANYADGNAAMRADFFNQLNAVRASAGIGLVAQNAKLDFAANSHADWLLLNTMYLTSSHVEGETTPGFYGATVFDRVKNAGYVVSTYAFPYCREVIGSGMGGANNAQDAVSRLVSAIYHRSTILDHGYTEVGVGVTDYSQGLRPAGTMDLCIPAGASAVDALGQDLPAGVQAVAWPLQGAVVNARMNDEAPYPVAGKTQATAPIGYPVSLFSKRGTTITATSFTLTEVASGAPVAVTMLTKASDPNAMFRSNEVAIFANAPLKTGTQYRADFAGTIDGQVFAKSWTFSTATTVQ